MSSALLVTVAFLLGVGVGVAWPLIGALRLFGNEEASKPEAEEPPVSFSGDDRRRRAQHADDLIDLY